MRKIFITVCLLGLGLTSCQKRGQANGELPEDFNSDIILKYAENLENMIDKTEISGIVDVSGEKIKVYAENFDDSASAHMLLFSWKNGNNFSVMTEHGTKSIDTYASIGIGHIERISAAEFENKYRQKTNEDVKAEIEAISKNEAVDPDIAIWELKELVKKAKSQSFEKMENVGSAAYWETPLNVLHILAKDVAFSISTNLDEDSEVNKQKAIAMAGFIFQKLKH